MAKIYGINGSMTGKLGNTVMSVRNGEQIARQYQPVVANPSTAAQVAARAKLKLLSQLSAVMAPVIAIPRRGNVSSRNLFLKKNYGGATYAGNTASVTLANVQLTNGILEMFAIQAVTGEGGLSVSVFRGDLLDVNRVVYVVFSKSSDDKLYYITSAVEQKDVANANFTHIFPSLPNAPLVIYAYGVRDNTENARVKFGDIQALSAETIAKLIVTSTLLESDITLTETRGVEYNPGA